MRVLILGDDCSSELGPVRDALQRHAPDADLRQAPDVASLDRCTEAWFPDLGIVCQRWPDEHPPSMVESLLGRFPLTRWICCFGAWCESDGRNRSAWPASVRVPARTAEGRILRELAVLRGEAVPLPLTASRDEGFAFDYGEFAREADERRLDLRGLLHVESPDRALRETYYAVGRSWGWRDAGTDSGERGRASVVLWDADPWSEETPGQLKALRERFPDAAIVALMNLAHPEDVDRLRAHGAEAVVAKLAAVEDLRRVVEESTGVRSRGSGTCCRPHRARPVVTPS